MTLIAERPEAPVWVVGETVGGPALALAGRLDLPFLRLRAAAPAAGPGPALVVSSGFAGAAKAVALRARFGCRVVHCAPFAPSALPFDLLVRPGGRRASGGRGGRVLSVIGPLHVVSAALLAEAHRRWSARLAHLPRPRVALVVRRGGFRALSPQALATLGRDVAAATRGAGGSVLASIDVNSGPAARAALSMSLGGCLHLLYRTDEPGEDPTLGFLGIADVVVSAGASATAVSEAAACSAPVFADPLDDFDRAGRRLLDTLGRADLVRPFNGDLSPWPREPLDEAGRVASDIRRRFAVA